MVKSENFYEMKRCKMDWLDDIYYGTKSSQGTRNAINAIKFVLFDDTSVIPDGLEIGDKYEFISSRKDGRAKAKMLQKIDLDQILCTYAMQSFGIKNIPFNITYDEYYNLRKKNLINKKYTMEYAVELMALALTDSIYGGYLFLNANKFIKNILLDSLINERYIEEKSGELDSFNGSLDNSNISDDIKKSYFDNFNKLDDYFLNIKRRDNSYLNYVGEN